MNTLCRVQLVSAPWAHPTTPSLAIAALKAHLDNAFGDEVETLTTSAFMDIPYRFRETFCLNLMREAHPAYEQISLLLHAKRYMKKEVGPASLGRLISSVNKLCEMELMNPETLAALEKSFTDYADEEIIPKLLKDGVNIIGFSMIYYQVHASTFLARYIEEKAPDIKKVFLYGGFSSTGPHIFQMFSEMGLSGYCVAGEGEIKLERIIKDLLGQKSKSQKPRLELKKKIPGVIKIGDSEGVTAMGSLEETQVENLKELPIPAYEEYFKKAHKLFETDPILKKLMPFYVYMEGSRGCFAKCDFCNLNSQFLGYRKSTAQSIFEMATQIMDRYDVSRIHFADTVCDPWAREFAELSLASGRKFKFQMNLRVHHPEEFWTLMSESGLDWVQLGIESLATPLLKKMAKGTTVVQNILAQKITTELGMNGSSVGGSNIILRHPKGTLEDAKETLRILDALPHFRAFSASNFYLGYGSPIYNELTLEQRQGLRPYGDKEVPKEYRPLNAAMAYDFGDAWPIDVAAQDMWSEISKKYRYKPFVPQPPLPTFSVTRQSDQLLIKDMRFGGSRELTLSGSKAKIYNICHQGRTINQLLEETGLSLSALKSDIEFMMNERLFLLVDQTYISIALRPRDELVANLRASTRKIR